MGQADCLEIIENSDDWINSAQISKKLNQHITLVGASLRKLHKSKDVIRRRSANRLGYEYKKTEKNTEQEQGFNIYNL